MADKDPKELAKAMFSNRQMVVVLVTKTDPKGVTDPQVEPIRTLLQEKTLPLLQSGWVRAIPLDCYGEFEPLLKEAMIRARESAGSEENLVEFTVMPFPRPGEKLVAPPDASDRVKKHVKKANTEMQFDVFPLVIHEGVEIARMMLTAEYATGGSLTPTEQTRVNKYMEDLAARLNEFEEAAEKKDKEAATAYMEKYYPLPKDEAPAAPAPSPELSLDEKAEQMGAWL